MGYVDVILNLAGLLLWLNWRSIRFDPLAKRMPATLMGTLRPADPKKNRRWHLLAIIAGLLVLRAAVYRWIGPLWVAKLDLVATVPQFRSNLFPDILVFSFLSFGLTLGIFYSGVLLLSLLQGPEPIHRLVKIPLGRVDGWPVWAKVLLPFAVTSVLWWVLSWPLDWMQKLPVSMPQRCEQSLVIGLAGYGVWKFPAGALLLLYLLNCYIYFGRHPFWKYVSVTAQTLLRPLKSIPLRIGRLDFAPVVGIAIVFLTAEGLERGLVWLYAQLPF